MLLLLALVGCATDPVDSADTALADPGCQALLADPTLLRWEGVEPGSVVTASFMATNVCAVGDDALLVAASSTDAAFVVDLTNELTLLPGQAATFVVTFTAIDNASHYGTIALDSNDATQPQQFVSLEGIVTTDADGDGFANLGAGGDDCDDGDADVHPGANEVWYDGVDQDCDGGSDFDQDLDGWPALAYGGNDCNDADADVHPGADEVLDDVDQDCDDMVDEDFVLPGEVIVAEVMPSPAWVYDDLGEWFEVQNVGVNRIDLFGWEVVNAAGAVFVVDRHVELVGGGTAVLGNNQDALTNGGVYIDAAYDGAGWILTGSDGIDLRVDGRVISSMYWRNAVDGAARQLDPDHLNVADAGEPAWWCDAHTSYSDADLGTPGRPNDPCTSVDEDGDGLTEDDGDCDDTDASINPDASDPWDGVDNDCDGRRDNPLVTDVATAVIDGSTSTYLTGNSGIGAGDVTGDGTDDLVLGANYASSYAGSVWVIDSADVIGASGLVSSLDLATVSGETYSYSAALPSRLADLDGDGTADLVVGGSPYTSYGGFAATLYAGGSSLSGIMDSDDAYATVENDADYGYGTVRISTSLDIDGDGVPELVHTDPYYSEAAATVYYSGRVALYDVSAATGALTEDDDATAVLTCSQGSGLLGWNSGGGDLNGDGYDDLVVGAPGVIGAVSGGGIVYVVTGRDLDGESDVEDVASNTIYGSTVDAGVGRGGIVVADFDASGGLDLAVGGPGAGEVYLFLDAGSLPDEEETNNADTTLDGPNTFGFALWVDDLDNDGRNDLAVGDPAINPTFASSYAWYTARGADVGQVFLYDRSVLTAGGTQPTTAAFAGLTGAARGDLFGAVLGGGDFNGDNAADLVVGAPATDGAAYVVLGN
ncbi:MAG: hypothetical protein EXR71_20310 [Myxococcales bacterium]|nr:hypothetical protein [Myxococcales bacterium]